MPRARGRVTLFGHDWGAAVAWFFAMHRVRALERLVILNVPHPALFRRALHASWRQRRRSWYAAFFQVPWLPEFLLKRDGARALGAAFRSGAHEAQFPQDLLAFYRAQASEPGALRAMLAWYRAAARGGMAFQVSAASRRLRFPR